MSINFAVLQGLTIPEGVVTKIEKDGVVLWSIGEITRLRVINSDGTYPTLASGEYISVQASRVRSATSDGSQVTTTNDEYVTVIDSGGT